MPITLAPALPDDLAWMNTIYEEINFQRADPDHDTCVVARWDDQRVGMGRLIHVDELSDELAGIYTNPDLRGRGIASDIVRWLIERSRARTIYCLPFDHLERYYASFGFRTAQLADCDPEAITSKLSWCAQSQPHDVILMTIDRNANAVASPQAG